MNFNSILQKYRKFAFSTGDLGSRFERLMLAYLMTDPKYAIQFKKVWLWNDFFAKNDLGGHDTGIDLVAQTFAGDFWAIQCKCFQEDSYIDKAAVDSFLATSSRTFTNEDLQTTAFAHRLWISTTNNWTSNAVQALNNQTPPCNRIALYDLQNAPVNWQKLDEGIHGNQAQAPKKSLRPHQSKAVMEANTYFKTNDRGKLIMACGAGKTYTALRIAETETDNKGFVLFLVPSIALLGQILNEWTAEAKYPINPVCICSDPTVSRRRTKYEDSDSFSIVDLALPASTDVQSIVSRFRALNKQGITGHARNDVTGMTVVFSTYQSIDVISKAQKILMRDGEWGIFDLIICDEAHRTTGVTLSGDDESAFVKVHDNDFIRAKKRLYMTATPRLFSDDSKTKAELANAELCSMDDVTMYGEEFYRIGFGQAVDEGLLTDYKVLILTLNQNDVSPLIQQKIADSNQEISMDDASKLIGCINALSKQVLGDDGTLKASDPAPMRRAVAFCQTIENSKTITSIFNTSAESYINELPPEKRESMQAVFSKHIDGTMDASKRSDLMTWLKEEAPSGECRVLTNVRCLSEGVDVPSLDAVMFLSAKNSQVDVVQSVGRVMRLSEGKKYGYIIIPVIIPFGVEPEKALDDIQRYKVVWTVLNALRSHDDRFNATINKIELNRKKPNNIIVGRPDVTFDENGNPVNLSGDPGNATSNKELAQKLLFNFEQLQSVVFARMVQKVGQKRYWEQWAKSVAQIAERQIERISNMIRTGEYKAAFDKFLLGLQKNINPSITGADAIEMLSQHIITKPVFEALFEGYSFVKNNPISISMQSMLDILEANAIEKDIETLQKFYDSVKKTVSNILDASGKQRIIIELYDKFFKTAFPKMVERLGIVYTPVEVVDFIIHSVDDILKQEFGRTISDENVNILDPFTGTGTFITRLIQSGLINPSDLKRKYEKELFANEIVLLAYYIAAVNIENAYHDVMMGNGEWGMGEDSPLPIPSSTVSEPAVAYQTNPKDLTERIPPTDYQLPATDYQLQATDYSPFNGICLTDTFQLNESDGKLQGEGFSPANTDRIDKQKTSPITVIMGNPPYSVGQRSANDNAQNQSYPRLDARIEKTYAVGSKASSIKALYDAYIKAFRWCSDRLGNNDGIIAFVSNGAWLDGNGMDGFRRCLEKEFSAIYVFDLRGNQRTSGELSRREGGKIFGSGSRTPIAITLLVKRKSKDLTKSKIFYHDIGDYLNREEKLSIIKKNRSISAMQFQPLSPNTHSDWINQRKNMPGIPIEPEYKFDLSCKSFFNTHSLGTATGRDSWAYNYSKDVLIGNMKSTINFFNSQSENFKNQKLINPSLNANDFIDTDPTKISWNRNLLQDLEKYKTHSFVPENIITGHYRPFCKQMMYFDKDFNAMLYQNKRLFPDKDTKNMAISVCGLGSTVPFSCLIINNVSDLGLISAGQCFPLYYYEENKVLQANLFDEASESRYIRRDAVSDFILERARQQYGKSVTKEDIFYYVYGFLHSPLYRETFASDLKKMLPRLPLVDDVRDFWKFSKVGRALADLHLNYESVPRHPDVIELHTPLPGVDALNQLDEEERNYRYYRVEKMRFPSKSDKSQIIYNSRITVDNIPPEAYGYIVNGKPAIEWIMERYQVTTHKESRITNDPNDWSRETANPRYILDLLHSIITLSAQSLTLIHSLPNISPIFNY